MKYVRVVYGYGQTRICGGSMWIGPLRMTRSDVSHVTGSDISHVTGSDISHVTGSGSEPEVTSVTRKYVLRMRNRKLRNIRRSRAPEVTSVTCPEETLTGSGPDRKRPCSEVIVCACATESCATVSRVFFLL